jgi:hypothetical protein
MNERRPWLAAFAWLAFLAPLFFVSYGLANWVTSMRSSVPSIAFAWERHIPFLAWTIVPYWSTDLFYGISLLLCRTRAELQVHVRRLITVQLICVAGFLAFPLRCTFEKPATSGLFGALFDRLMSFDKPFNQAPSLHVALTAVLWAAFLRHLRGPAMWAVRIWFLMMALSTLTTYQHQFIDLPLGLWVGLFAIAMFPHTQREHAGPSPVSWKRFRLSARYLIGAALCVAVAVWLGGLAWLMLWPAGALLLVSGIYAAGRPELFGKSQGAMAWLLAPHLAAASLNCLIRSRGHAPANEIADGVWLGRSIGGREREQFGFASVVDVAAELPADTNGIEYRAVPMLDLVRPSETQLAAAVKAVNQLESHRPTLVCCALGLSRGAAVVAAWLVATHRAPTNAAALDAIRARRPEIVL